MYVFSNTRYFYRHLQTPHENRADRVEAPQEVNEKLRCSHCKDDFEGIVLFAKHVQAVLKNWDKTSQGEITVKCPAKFCRNRNVASYPAFRKHWSRWHKDTAAQRQPRTICEDLDANLEACAVEDDSSAEDHHGDDDCAGSMYSDEEPPADSFSGIVQREVSRFVAALARIKTAHAVTQLALDKIIDAFADLNATSQEYQTTSTDPNRNIMNHILSERLVATASKRETVMKNDMHLLDKEVLYLGRNDITGEPCYCEYFPVKQVLVRFFNDPSAVASFKEHKASVQKAWLDGIHGYGDYFTSAAFKELLNTLTEEEKDVCDGVPLVIGMYR